MKSEFNQRTSHAHLIYNNFYLRKCETGGEVGQLPLYPQSKSVTIHPLETISHRRSDMGKNCIAGDLMMLGVAKWCDRKEHVHEFNPENDMTEVRKRGNRGNRQVEEKYKGGLCHSSWSLQTRPLVIATNHSFP